MGVSPNHRFQSVFPSNKPSSMDGIPPWMGNIYILTNQPLLVLRQLWNGMHLVETWPPAVGNHELPGYAWKCGIPQNGCLNRENHGSPDEPTCLHQNRLTFQHELPNLFLEHWQVSSEEKNHPPTFTRLTKYHVFLIYISACFMFGGFYPDECDTSPVQKRLHPHVFSRTCPIKMVWTCPNKSRNKFCSHV